MTLVKARVIVSLAAVHGLILGIRGGFSFCTANESYSKFSYITLNFLEITNYESGPLLFNENAARILPQTFSFYMSRCGMLVLTTIPRLDQVLMSNLHSRKCPICLICVY